ncbi:hypothetical protein ColLi_09173 [Colletotrichum liriopes]|uniref:Uncharacterized protein n=1 Tax=Colletotrichum liriopes TaxID=708192 RepID=A0AA37LUY3_9PEZI|nr:hypothetical protein ColLi_09173 [Colletotrichum liriopes]
MAQRQAPAAPQAAAVHRHLSDMSQLARSVAGFQAAGISGETVLQKYNQTKDAVRTKPDGASLFCLAKLILG